MISAELFAVPEHFYNHSFQMINYQNEEQLLFFEMQNHVFVGRVNQSFGRRLINSFRQNSFELRQKIFQSTILDRTGQHPELQRTWRDIKQLLKTFILLYNQIHLFSRPLMFSHRRPAWVINQSLQGEDYIFHLYNRHNIGFLNSRNINLFHLRQNWILFTGRAVNINSLESSEIVLNMRQMRNGRNMISQWLRVLFALYFFHLEDRTQGCFMLCSKNMGEEITENRYELVKNEVLGKHGFCKNYEAFWWKHLSQWRQNFEEEDLSQWRQNFEEEDVFRMENEQQIITGEVMRGGLQDNDIYWPQDEDRYSKDYEILKENLEENQDDIFNF